MEPLRDYQKEDVNFFLTRKTAGCFNEQRTGKTPTILTVLDKRKVNKFIIICPASAILQWVDEIKRWTNYSATPIIGSKAKKEKALEEDTNGYVIGYDSFKTTKTHEGFVNTLLTKNPDAIILDEAHKIKNPKTAVFKAIAKTTSIPIRYALTGTPAQGKAYDIWAILHWLYPAMFKSYWAFIQDNFYCFNRQGKFGNSFMDIGGWKPGKESYLQHFLNEISTNRKRKDVMKWLPEKDYQRILLPCSDKQKKMLKELKDYFETENIITHGVLDRLIRYRQICCSPKLLGVNSEAPKVTWLKEFIEDYPEKPIIVFSKFTQFLKLIKEELNLPDCLIIGETPIKKRNEIKLAFQTGKLNILLINIDAGKEALTLDRAEAAIFTDKFPPIADIQQAEDRFIATTEERASKPHTIYELIMKDTYDEQIHKLLHKRASETDIINDYKKYLKGGNAS